MIPCTFADLIDNNDGHNSGNILRKEMALSRRHKWRKIPIHKAAKIRKLDHLGEPLSFSNVFAPHTRAEKLNKRMVLKDAGFPCPLRWKASDLGSPVIQSAFDN
jgi:hypothetical protein